MAEISVIVPVFNVRPYLEECVDSLLAQTIARDIEIILVDDGSTDGSGNICDAYSDAYANVIAMHQLNAGVSAARNAGLKRAAGTYVGFCDGDDYVLPDMYETLVTLMKTNGADISMVNYCVLENENKLRISGSGRETKWTGREAIRAFLLEKMKIEVWNKLFRKRVINGEYFVEGKSIAEDKYFLFRALLKAKTVCFKDAGKYVYRKRNESTMGRRFSGKNLDSLFFLDRIEETVRQRFPDMSDVMRCHRIRTYYNMLRLLKRKDSGREFAELEARLFSAVRDYPLSIAIKYLPVRKVAGIGIMKLSPALHARLKG